jgi:hypothetical protein
VGERHEPIDGSIAQRCGRDRSRQPAQRVCRQRTTQQLRHPREPIERIEQYSILRD